MGFYLRKSLRFGPIRLNLSKSGLGISAGVKGARLGLNARGRAYVHAGRYGLYYRKMLPAGGAGAGERRGRAGGGRGSAGPPIELEEPTDATYPADGALASSAARNGSASALATAPWAPAGGANTTTWGWVAVGSAFVLLLGLGSGALGEVGLAGLALAVSGGAVLTGRAQRRAVQGLEKELAELLGRAPGPDAATPSQLQQAIAAAPLSEEERAFERRRVYHALLKAAIADGRVDEAEAKQLEAVATALALDAGFLAEARHAAYHEAFLEAVADHELTPEEEQGLAATREQLGIAPEAIQAERATLTALRALREIRQGQLPRVACSQRLRKGEVCHYQGEARLLARRVLRRRQREGRKVVVRGLVVKKEGTLFITDRRLLLVHTGTTSIPFAKLLDLEVDPERNLLTLTKDGAVHPIFLSVPDAPRAAAILATAAGL